MLSTTFGTTAASRELLGTITPPPEASLCDPALFTGLKVSAADGLKILSHDITILMRIADEISRRPNADEVLRKARASTLEKIIESPGPIDYSQEGLNRFCRSFRRWTAFPSQDLPERESIDRMHLGEAVHRLNLDLSTVRYNRGGSAEAADWIRRNGYEMLRSDLERTFVMLTGFIAARTFDISAYHFITPRNHDDVKAHMIWELGRLGGRADYPAQSARSGPPEEAEARMRHEALFVLRNIGLDERSLRRLKQILKSLAAFGAEGAPFIGQVMRNPLVEGKRGEYKLLHAGLTLLGEMGGEARTALNHMIEAAEDTYVEDRLRVKALITAMKVCSEDGGLITDERIINLKTILRPVMSARARAAVRHYKLGEAEQGSQTEYGKEDDAA